MPPEVWDRVAFDGLWDFTGGETKPKYDGPDAPLLKLAAREIDQFVRNLWVESEWECAWFMNPPVSKRTEFRQPTILLILTRSI